MNGEIDEKRAANAWGLMLTEFPGLDPHSDEDVNGADLVDFVRSVCDQVMGIDK